MEFASNETVEDRLYLRALGIRYEHMRGLWLPIMWHIALRGHTGAMIELADWYSYSNRVGDFGKTYDAFSPAGLYYRAYRKGDGRAAFNAAMSCFNRNDMKGYRQWLMRASNVGYEDATRQLGYFETRLWHSAARKIGRLRPRHRRDDIA